MTRVFDHSLLNGLAMSVGSPKIYNYPSDLSDQEKQKWRDMVDFVPGFAELAAIKIDINMEVQPASPNLLIAQNFFNDIVQVSPYHDLETLKQPGGGFEPTIVELSLHSGHKIVFDRRAQQVVISGPQENITRIQSFTELLKNNTNGWDALPIILEPAIAAKSATEEVIFELAEEPKAAEAKRSPHAFSLDEVEEIVQKGFSEAKKDVSKASLVQQYETLIENINALKGKSVFEVGTLPDNPSFDLIHARIALLKEQLVDKPAQVSTENNQNRSTTGYTRHIPGGNATRRFQTRKSLAQETASQTDNVATASVVDTIVAAKTPPQNKVEPYSLGSWANGWGVKEIEKLKPYSMEGWATGWGVVDTTSKPHSPSTHISPMDSVSSIVDNEPPNAAQRHDRTLNKQGWVTRNWQEVAIGAAAGLTKTFILAGAGLTGPAGLALSLGLTGLIGGLNRMRRTHKQRKQLLKEGKPLPETSKYFWLKEFGKGAAVSAVTAGLFMGAAEFIDFPEVGQKIVDSFKGTSLGSTGLAQAAENSADLASPTTQSTGADPASLATVPVNSIQDILTADQIKSLPAGLQKLAAGAKTPAELLHFAKEASFDLLNKHGAPSEATRKACLNLIVNSIQAADAHGVEKLPEATQRTLQKLCADATNLIYRVEGHGDISKMAPESVEKALKLAKRAGTAVHNYGGKWINMATKFHR